MSPGNTPYVFRDEPDGTDADADPAADAEDRPTTGEREVVIVDGRAMSYRWYRRDPQKASP